MDKIGIGIVTCNRPKFFLKCFNSIPDSIELVVVNDGTEFSDVDKLQKKRHFKYIHNKTNLGVGKSKNILLQELLDSKCQHLFLIEDDIVVKDKNVFNEYIKASKVTGIQHFNFGYHGPANRNGISGGPPTPRFIVDYGDVQIAINANSVGAFSYYTREALLKTGLIDEEYTNAFEHVDHDYRLYKNNFYTPYWNFADIANSANYLDEIECSENSSAIRPRSDWRQNIEKGYKIFTKKHGYAPAWENRVPDSSKEEVIKFLKSLKTK